MITLSEQEIKQLLKLAAISIQKEEASLDNINRQIMCNRLAGKYDYEGIETGRNIIKELIDQNNHLSLKLGAAEMEIHSLKDDIRTIARIFNNFRGYSPEFESLKGKYSIY